MGKLICGLLRPPSAVIFFALSCVHPSCVEVIVVEFGLMPYLSYVEVIMEDFWVCGHPTCVEVIVAVVWLSVLSL